MVALHPGCFCLSGRLSDVCNLSGRPLELVQLPLVALGIGQVRGLLTLHLAAGHLVLTGRAKQELCNFWEDPEAVAEALGLLVDDGLDRLVVNGHPSLLLPPLAGLAACQQDEQKESLRRIKS